MKTILLSHRRSGSTLMYNCFNNYHLSISPSFLKVPGEINTPDASNAGNYDKLYAKLNINRLKILQQEENEMSRLFLKILNLETFFIKYFPKRIDKYFSYNSLISKINSRNINVDFLYRKNLLEGLISDLISRHEKKWQSSKIKTSPIEYNNITFTPKKLHPLIEDHVSELFECYKTFNKLNSIGKINNIYEYEQHIQTNNFPYSSYKGNLKKMNTTADKNIVLQNNPEISNIFSYYLNQYNIEVDSSFKLTQKF